MAKARDGRHTLLRPTTPRRPFKKVVGLRRSSGSAKCNRLHQRQTSKVNGSSYRKQPAHNHTDSASTQWERGRRLRSLSRPLQQTLQVGNQAGVHKDLAPADNTDKHSPASSPLASSPVAAPCARTQHVRQKQHALHNQEAAERQTLIEQYKATGDFRVFSSILSPFLPQAELGEWQWDDEVERWWREDKTTGRRLWAPTENFF